MVTRVLPSRCFDLLLSLSALTDSLPSTLFSRSTHKLSFAEMTNPARLLFQNSGRVLDFSLLLLSNSPSLADGFLCLADFDCLCSREIIEIIIDQALAVHKIQLSEALAQFDPAWFCSSPCCAPSVLTSSISTVLSWMRRRSSSRQLESQISLLTVANWCFT
ncbi:hypothetical protein FF2_034664 [Malus domestica]